MNDIPLLTRAVTLGNCITIIAFMGLSFPVCKIGNYYLPSLLLRPYIKMHCKYIVNVHFFSLWLSPKDFISKRGACIFFFLF